MLPAPIFAFETHELRASAHTQQGASVLLFSPQNSHVDAPSVCWRVTRIPRVAYVELLDGEDANDQKLRLAEALHALLCTSPVSPGFALQGPMERKTCAQISYPLHSKQSTNHVADAPHTTRCFRAFRIEYFKKIDWQHQGKRCAAWEPWRARLHLEQVDAVRRLRWDKHLYSSGWLRATRYASPSFQPVFSQCDREYVVDYDDIVPACDSTEETLAQPHLVQLTFSMSQRHDTELVHTNSLPGDLHADVYSTRQSTPVQSIAMVRHVVQLGVSLPVIAETRILVVGAPGGTQEENNPGRDAVSYYATERQLLVAFFNDWIASCDVLVAWQLHDVVLASLLARLDATATTSHLWYRLGRVAASSTTAYALQSSGKQLVWRTWYESNRDLPGGRLLCDAFRCCSSTYLFPPHNCTNIAQLEQTLLPNSLRLQSPLSAEHTGVLCAPALVPVVLPAANYAAHVRRVTHECITLHFLFRQHLVLPILYQVSQLLGCALRFNMETTNKVPINDASLATAFYQAGFIVNNLVEPSGWTAKTALNSLSKKMTPSSTYGDENRPDVLSGGAGGKHGKFQGGMWLEAVRGLHELAFELDVEAMYSNIFLAGNLCFSTLPLASLTQRERHAPSLDLLQANRTEDDDALGVVPRLCRRLLSVRTDIRTRLAAADSVGASDRTFLEAKRKAVKLCNNIIYGCLGQQSSHFANEKMAAMVASFGRALLTEAVTLINTAVAEEREIVTGSMPLDVSIIYGATDSLHLASGPRLVKAIRALDCDAARECALRDIAKRCSQILCNARPAFNWVLDNVFRRILLLEKNRFVAVLYRQPSALSLTKDLVYKGVDVTQGGMCYTLSQLRRLILADMVLMLPPLVPATHDDDAAGADTMRRMSFLQSNLTRRLRQWQQEVRVGRVPVEHFVTINHLSQALRYYSEESVMQHGHVQAARMLAASGTVLVGKGHPIEHVQCISDLAAIAAPDGSGGVSIKRSQAYPLDVVRKDTTDLFIVDTRWYVDNQFVPTLKRDLSGLGFDLDMRALQALLLKGTATTIG